MPNLNRREALSALAALPMVSAVKVADEEPMPIVAVIEIPQRLSSESLLRLRDLFAEKCGGKLPFPVIVLEHGATINFISQKKAEEIAKSNA